MLRMDGRDDEMIVSGGENVFPREVVFVDELPRNPSGKVLKRELAECYGACLDIFPPGSGFPRPGRLAP